MVSRIIPQDRKEAYPDNDIESETIGLAHGRCLKYYDINGNPQAVRYFAHETVFEPLIAKGNRFDGVEAVY